MVNDKHRRRHLLALAAGPCAKGHHKPACIDGAFTEDGQATCCSQSVPPMWKSQTLLLSRTLSVSFRSSAHVDTKFARRRAGYVCCSAIQTPPAQAPAMGPMGAEQNGMSAMPKVISLLDPPLPPPPPLGQVAAGHACPWRS